MIEENIIENTGPKYSEMLMQLVEGFDEQLPEKLTFEDTLEVGIDAWNLANKKEFLVSRNLYEQELKSYKYHSIIDKMVTFKIEKFPNSNNVIVDYSIENDILSVKTKTQQDIFNSIIKQVIHVKSKTD